LTKNVGVMRHLPERLLFAAGALLGGRGAFIFILSARESFDWFAAAAAGLFSLWAILFGFFALRSEHWFLRRDRKAKEAWTRRPVVTWMLTVLAVGYFAWLVYKDLRR